MNSRFTKPLLFLATGLIFTSFLSNLLEGTQNADRQISQKKKKKAKGFQKKSTREKESAILLSDPAMSQKWGTRHIHLSKALRVSQGSADTVIAVIDTGIDVNHPDLKNNLWVNTNETGKDSFGRDKASNGIDDDKNGCIDDVYGCNFITGKGTWAELADNHGHGSHISGIIAAEGGNGIGVSGVAPRARIMTLKYYDPKARNSNNLMNTVRAIEYAVWMKKNYKDANGKPLIKKMIINYSGGGTEYSVDEFRAVNKARKAGILFVAAAGNERSNSDKHKYYPASYDLDNIISVTAINPKTQVLASSNYGKRTVDIAAPGENIFSTLPSGRYGFMTGTSQATAFVTGVAALVMAHHKEFDAAQVKKYILKTGDNIPSLQNLVGTSKRLNSYRALVTMDQDVNAMGVPSTNTANLSSAQFAAFGSSDGNSLQTRQIARFGKRLMQALRIERKEKKKEKN